MENTFISYYSNMFSAWICCNLEPVCKRIYLSADDDFEMINGKLTLRIKFAKGLKW